MSAEDRPPLSNVQSRSGKRLLPLVPIRLWQLLASAKAAGMPRDIVLGWHYPGSHISPELDKLQHVFDLVLLKQTQGSRPTGIVFRPLMAIDLDAPSQKAVAQEASRLGIDYYVYEEDEDAATLIQRILSSQNAVARGLSILPRTDSATQYSMLMLQALQFKVESHEMCVLREPSLDRILHISPHLER